MLLFCDKIATNCLKAELVEGKERENIFHEAMTLESPIKFEAPAYFSKNTDILIFFKGVIQYICDYFFHSTLIEENIFIQLYTSLMSHEKLSVKKWLTRCQLC